MTGLRGRKGAGLGAAAGGAVGIEQVLGVMAIPGVGPVVAAGGRLPALGALAGGAAGSLIGALVENGVPEEDAHVYAEGRRRGGVLLTVSTARKRTTDRGNSQSVRRRHPKRRTTTAAQAGMALTDASPYTADQIRSERERRL